MGKTLNKLVIIFPCKTNWILHISRRIQIKFLGTFSFKHVPDVVAKETLDKVQLTEDK